jgi:hypothetical protein
MGLENIHGGSAFSRTLLVAMFPTVSLTLKYKAFAQNTGVIIAALVSAYLLWVVVVYWGLRLSEAYE